MTPTFLRRYWLHTAIIGGLVLAAGPPSAAQSTRSPDQTAFFETKIRPLLVDQCGKCHGPAEQSGGLRLDSSAALLKGGARGPAVVPGAPAQSLLIRAVSHLGDAPKMPPGKKLSDRQIADLTRWVQSGAIHPSPLILHPAAKHWAFQPVRTPAPPTVTNRKWVRNPIDAFVLAKLEARRLKPAPPADRRTLLRRATFDLTGLPPTPAELEAYLDDRQPGAWERVIDRLLASPAYGERWGRHWLDVARYADSNGLDENLVYANAWRYRDYVIRALNEDRPIDRFIQEQIAGDLLPPGPDDHAAHDRLVATGFLALGAKMLAEDDPVKQEEDIIDEQVDTLGRAFMGLTLGCARCHDHKFDPIPQTDYYALAGIFKSTQTMRSFKVVAEWQELPLVGPPERQKLAVLEKDLEARQADRERLRKEIESAPSETARAALAALDETIKKLEATYAAAPRAMAVSEGKPADMRVRLRGNYLTLGDDCPRRFPTVLAGASPPSIALGQSGRLELARWLTRPEHPLTARVFVNRVWRWHFGRGIVGSTDNFGALGDRPDNQPLLDYLAASFAGLPGAAPPLKKPWSLKELHRLIMLSSTYRMSSRFDARAAALDPENRLHWRHERRRLEAEEIRDAILAAGGQLDRTMGGTLLKFRDREYVTNTANADPVDYRSRRRSVYLPVIRSALYDVFTAFDFGDPSVMNGDRPTTTIAPQALFMMNSQVVLEQSKALAEALLARPELGEAGRLRLAWETCYARPVTPVELRRSLELLDRAGRAYAAGEPDPAIRRRRAWQSLVKSLISASEFLYIE